MEYSGQSQGCNMQDHVELKAEIESLQIRTARIFGIVTLLIFFSNLFVEMSVHGSCSQPSDAAVKQGVTSSLSYLIEAA